VPAVGPVQSPRIGSQDALGPGTITLAGLTPIVSWSAPTIGPPTRYEVRLHWLDGATGATVAKPVAAFQVAGTSLQIQVPADILELGKTYFGEIIAYRNGEDRFDVAPLRATQVFSHATTLTSPFTP
jgi:hypothetical protein